MSRRSRAKVSKSPTSSVEATPARLTVLPLAAALQPSRALALSSSASLMLFARALFSARIQHEFGGSLPGLGGDSELASNLLVTLCCPSDCGPVALAGSIDGIGCSCSVNYPTPTATDWKGGKARKRGQQSNLRDLWKEWTGQTYLPPEVSAAVQGFPIMWTKCRQ